MTLNILKNNSPENGESYVPPLNDTPEGVIDYDELIGELSRPTHFGHKYGHQSQEPATGGGIFSPFDSDAQDEIAVSELMQKSGEYMARMEDAVLSFGLATYAKDRDTGPYCASEEQLRDLSDGWAEIAAKQDIKVNPYFKVMFSTFTTYLPKAMLAHAHRIEEISRAQELLTAQQDEQEARIRNLEREKRKKTADDSETE